MKLLAIGIVLLAFLLRVFHLGYQQLWLDEAISFHFATTPERLSEILALENSPPLYYLLLRIWLPIAGFSEAAIRFPSVIAGTLGVLAIMWVGRHIFGPAAGLWAGAFAAVSPIHVYYSQEARTYAVLILALALTYGLLWRAMQRNTWLSWAMVSLAALAALYSHYLSVIGLVPSIVLIWAWPRDADSGKRAWRFLAACMLCGLLYAPWLAWAFVFTSRAEVVDPSSFWSDLWKATPPAMAIPRTLEVFALGPQRDLVMIHMKQFAWLKLPEALRWVGLAGLMVLAVWVAGPWQEARMRIPWLGRRKAWVVSLLAMPLALLWLVSLYRPVYVPGRYDQVAFVGYALLVGFAFAKLQTIKRFGNAAVILVALWLLVPIGTKLTLYYKAPAGREAEATARALHLLVQDGDLVVFNAVRGISVLAYYLPRLDYGWNNGSCRSIPRRREFACRMFPPEMETTFLPPAKRSPEELRADVATFLRPITAAREHLWVVLFDGGIRNGALSASRPEDLALVAELMRAGFQPETVNFNEVPAIYLFRRYTPGIAQTLRG